MKPKAPTPEGLARFRRRIDFLRRVLERVRATGEGTEEAKKAVEAEYAEAGLDTGE